MKQFKSAFATVSETRWAAACRAPHEGEGFAVIPRAERAHPLPVHRDAIKAYLSGRMSKAFHQEEVDVLVAEYRAKKSASNKAQRCAIHAKQRAFQY